MRIHCPDCSAEYEVPLERMAPGRQVRCAKCSTRWAPLPEPEKPPPAIEPAPGPELEPHSAPPIASPEPEPKAPVAEPAPVPSPSRQRIPAMLALAWLLSIAALAGAGYAALTYRAAITHAWPPAARAYAWLGLHH